MAKFFGVRLSENIIKRPDGFIVCMGAVIARTGFQIYKGSELDKDELESLGIRNVTDEDEIKVLRLYEDVFRKETLASFEGTVFTLTHPGALVTVSTINESNQGHIQNVRVGNEPLPDGNWPLIADIFVTGQEAIDAILIDGVRELSCGYNYKLKLVGGQICQFEIIGNHVALVESGRAGRYAAIKDSAPQEGIMAKETEKLSVKFLRALGLHTYAKNATPEQFATALDSLAVDETKEEAKDEETTEVNDMKHISGCKGGDSCTCGKDNKPEAKDADFRARMHAALDRKIDAAKAASALDDDKTLANLLQGGNGGLKSKSTEGLDSEESETNDEEMEGEDSEEEEANDSEEEAEDSEEEEGEAHDSEEEEVEGEDEAVESNPPPPIPAEKRFKSYVPSATDAAAFTAGATHVLNILKPVIAQSGNKKMIKAFDTARKAVKGKAFGRDGYKAFASAAGKRSKEAMDSQPKSALQLQKEAYEAMDKEYAASFRKG